MADWADLPQLVIEKIIRYAVFSEFEEVKDGPYMNFWSLRVHDYSRVCQNWRSAIFSSKLLFLSSEADKHGIVYDDEVEAEAMMLIREGFLSMTKKLYIDKSPEFIVLFTNYALGNSIEEFDVITTGRVRLDDCGWTSADFEELILIISVSKWANTFTVEMTIDSQEAVTSFWKLLLAMIHSNQRADKTINLQLRVG